MVLGIKVGPQKNSIDDIEKTHTPYVEVWFRIDKLHDYDKLFSYLTAHHITTGLHFWGELPHGFAPSLVAKSKNIREESMRYIRQTIDVAARYGFVYVNIHPGYRADIMFNLEKQIYTVCSDPSTLTEAKKYFIEEEAALFRYAVDRNVLLTTETTCLFSINDFYTNIDRTSQKPINTYEFGIKDLSNTELPHAIANDFSHTGAQITASDPDTVWQYLYEKTRTYKDRTKLIHLGFLIPPYNGTDFHDQLDNPFFEKNSAVPNKKTTIQLLKLFQKRDDIFIIVEPKKDHPKNYFLAQKLLSTAGVLTP